MSSGNAAALFVALAAIPGVGVPRFALAAESTCSTVDVQADPRVRSRWPGLSDRIREAFGGRDDVDACARIDLTMRAGSTLDVTVVLPDGRSASRSAGADDVLPTLKALLLVPRVESSETPAPATSAPSVPSAGAAASADASPPADGGPLRVEPAARDASHDVAFGHARPPSPPSSRLGIELSVVTAARIGDGQTGLGLGALSLVDVGGWLAGFEGQVDSYRQRTGGPIGGALEVDALAGRRFRFENVAVDLLAGPALALRGGTQTMIASPGGPTRSVSDRELVPRAVFVARLNLAARSVLRGFVGLEGELGPAGASGQQLPKGAPDFSSDAPGLPIWTVGLALGATVGTP
jgi:hypothetical protein